jgi:hypothetical protein
VKRIIVRLFFVAPFSFYLPSEQKCVTKNMKEINWRSAQSRSGGRRCAEVSVLYAPAWDRQVDAFWHGHIAVMRAVEDGFSLMRSAEGGFLTVEETAAIHSLIRR